MSHPTTPIDDAKRQAREYGLVDTDGDTDLDPADMDSYQTQAAQFRERTQITDPDAQFQVLVEEVGELAEALNREDRTALAEELADVLVTVFVLADVEAIDVQAVYDRTMDHNLQKSGAKQGGKVVDDAAE